MRSTLLIGWRLWRIIGALLRFYVLPIFLPGRYADSPEKRLRLVLQTLGGAWTKAGQALALRFDLLPRKYCVELLKLLSENEIFSYEKIRQIIFQELGKYPEEIFASFDTKPLAVASIAQVHRATTHGGELLAIKVQRPGARAQFESDFRIIRMISRVVGVVDAFGGSSIRAFSAEFERWTHEELDFKNEARNGHRLWLRGLDDPIQHCAKIHFEYCSDRILASELLVGVSLLDLVDATRRRNLNEVYSRKRIAQSLFWCMCNQIFRDGVFHADPHPANIIILADGKIGFVDFGETGQLPSEVQSVLARHFIYLYRGDIERALNELLQLLIPSGKSDLRQAREDLLIAFEEFRLGVDESKARRREVTTGLFVKTMSITRRHRILMPPALALYYKTALTIDALLGELSPEYDLLSELHRFFVKAIARDKAEPVHRIAETILAMQHRANRLLSETKTFAAPLQYIEHSLRSVQTRSTLYGVWSVAFCIGAYLSHRDEAAFVQQAIGIDRHWVAYGLLLIALIPLLLMHRQLKRIPKGFPDT
jgi:ubiquinone biosynthesis protein